MQVNCVTTVYMCEFHSQTCLDKCDIWLTELVLHFLDAGFCASSAVLEVRQAGCSPPI